MIVHHIGYLVKNLKKSQKKFEELGFTAESDAVYDEYRKVNILFMNNGGYRIELIESAAEDSVVANLYGRYKNSPYHLCYISEDFEKDIEELRDRGFTQIDEPCPAPALGHKRVTFFMNASIGMIELLEK